jgi:YD repeat-containing protein
MGEYSYTYDDQNRCIGYVHPFGSGSFKYDGNHIYKINPNGKISKTIEYNEDGNYIHIVSDNGVEQWREYDEDGNLIHIKNSSGYEYWATYKEI